MTVDRRTFLRGSAATALAIAGAGLLDGGIEAAGAAAPTPFDVHGHDHKVFGPRSLSFRSGWQSFDWGTHAKQFFYVQPSPSKLRGKKAGTIVAKQHGDLRLSTISRHGDPGKRYMQLTGFGHGGSMGVEATASHDYIWLGCYGTAFDTKHPKNSSSTAIACFRWTGDNKTYTPGQIAQLPYSAVYRLKHGSSDNSVVYDESTNRILLRYTVKLPGHATAGTYYAVYRADHVRSQGDAAKPEKNLDNIPAGPVESVGHGSLQSFSLWGNVIYVLRGTKGKTDATLSAYDIASKKVTGAPYTALNGTKGREPEGLCVYRSGRTRQLCVGIKNDAKGSNQTSAVYYKGS